MSRTTPTWRASGRPATEVLPEVNKLIVLIRAAFGNDLTAYKPTTIDRRIERRMALHRIEKQSDYVKYVLATPDELGLLYKDMLISVTSFFRDAEPFEALRTRIFPRILENKTRRARSIRVWVPACSTGEEVYSIAIELLEFLGDRAPEYRLQVFGTDVDEDSIKQARRGLYPENIELDVSAERLQRFFFKNDGKYQVSRRVRDMVVFSNQNVIKDAPFSRLDLVTCRNLLIYLRPAVQKKVLRILNYSLLPTGYLMLGTSETVGDASEYFRLVDRKNKIYSKRHVASAGTLDISFGVQPVDPRRPSELPTQPAHDDEPGHRRRAQNRRAVRARRRRHQRGHGHRPHPRPHRSLPGADAGRAQLQHPAPGPPRPARRSAPRDPRRQIAPRPRHRRGPVQRRARQPGRDDRGRPHRRTGDQGPVPAGAVPRADPGRRGCAAPRARRRRPTTPEPPSSNAS